MFPSSFAFNVFISHIDSLILLLFSQIWQLENSLITRCERDKSPIVRYSSESHRDLNLQGGQIDVTSSFKLKISTLPFVRKRFPHRHESLTWSCHPLLLLFYFFPQILDSFFPSVFLFWSQEKSLLYFHIAQENFSDAENPCCFSSLVGIQRCWIMYVSSRERFVVPMLVTFEPIQQRQQEMDSQRFLSKFFSSFWNLYRGIFDTFWFNFKGKVKDGTM